ncbi:hypothetical protein OIU85_004926 [Salix viminalis]|uniref:non-specific serine/threonine protein kinase n=1 Tax=Salix viminalis TaxID=40686 RepID=A0A9Q0SYJ8_SALVM|nr:hypothetical protein OIU85_004926 [Salix viminalis]
MCFHSIAFLSSTFPTCFLPMGHHHPYLLFSLFLLLFSTATADDGATILKLANSLTPLPSGWSTKSSTTFCSWQGIRCDSSKSRVTSISLSKLSVSGTLPPEISTLSELQSLSVQGNQLSGDLPSLANLTNLQYIFLDFNNFTSIPPSFFQGLTGLQTFSVGNNVNLSPWQLPTDLAQCTSLTTLTANDCQLYGSIPDVFLSLPSLQNLRLSYNNLTGVLPPSFANSGIQNLWVNNQKFGLTGSVEVIGSMTQLSQVWLHMNRFTGPIPDLTECKSIFDLQLRDNQFTGIVPASLVSLPNLVNVSLSNNKFQGPVPQFPPSVITVKNEGSNKYCAGPGVPCDALVMTLLEIAGGFGYPSTLSDKWDGSDACGWPLITCDVGKKNVVTVNLAKQQFTGIISPSFAKLSSLRSLYLNENNLTGSIPDSLSKLPELETLDVSNNNLSGKIPEFPSSVKLITKPGNPFLGTDVDTGSSSGGTISGTSNGGSSAGSTKILGGVIAGIIVAVVIFIVVLSFVLYKYKKRHPKSGKELKWDGGKAFFKNGVSGGGNGYNVTIALHSQSNGGDNSKNIFEGGNVAVPIEFLRQVTDNFHEINIIGRGGFGVVYRGELHDGSKIAVKRMESTVMGNKGMGEFQAEIAVLTKVRHRHLVALLGYCINGNERLLVYEYMPEGTLGQHLFECHDYRYTPLTWKQRITIALDVARGVEYLHGLAQQSFIHRDLKTSNILLGDDMRAKVADFGLVKNAPDGNYSVETRLAGTFGYLAPEYAATGRVTSKVDVFAFGVVLMEIITGRKAVDDTRPEEVAHLVTWFRRILTTKENVPKVIDEFLNPDEETLATIYTVAELAGHCTARDPYQRPDMGHAVNVLAPLVQQWRPASQQEDLELGADLDADLPETLRRWQTEEGISMVSDDTSLTQTRSSAPSMSSGFANTFTSNDCR